MTRETDAETKFWDASKKVACSILDLAKSTIRGCQHWCIENGGLKKRSHAAILNPSNA